MKLNFFTVFFIVLLQSCTSLLIKPTNDMILSSVKNSDWLISYPEKLVDLNTLTGVESLDQSAFRLIPDEYYQEAFIANGRQITGRIDLADPSDLILRELINYYKTHYGFRIVDQGLPNSVDISNLSGTIERNTLSSTIKFSDFVINVKLKRLSLIPNKTNTYYLDGEIQLTIYDVARENNLIEDICLFSEEDNSQSLDYYSSYNGLPINQFLMRQVHKCADYFIHG